MTFERDINGQKRDTGGKNVTRDTSRARIWKCHGVTVLKSVTQRDNAVSHSDGNYQRSDSLTALRADGRHGLSEGRDRAMKPIRAGDLVMVVKPEPCCGDQNDIGYAFRVMALEDGRDWACSECHTLQRGVMALIDADNAVNTSRLIRINPPALLESVETEREVVA